MVLKKFRINIIIQIAALVALIFVLSYLVFKTSLYATMFIVCAAIIIQITYLIRYVERTNQYLIRFFDAVKYSDFSQSFLPEGLGSSFDALRRSFSDVISAFRKNRSEKEEQYRYLQTVVKHVGVGLIAFKKQGEVKLVNSAAKKLFKIAHLKNIHSLESISPALVEQLLQIKAGKKTLIKLYHNDEFLQLAVYATEFKLAGEKIILISIQDIQGELEEKEMEAWQNLIHILTHEIMNSITPITSLTATVNEILSHTHNLKQNLPDLDDIQQAINTIHKRSEGLMQFVESYRSLTLLPNPDFQIVGVARLFEQVVHLQQNELDLKNISVSQMVKPQTLKITADPEMFERVLINLLLNAIHALENTTNPRIELTAELNERSKVVIRVTDNGKGILPEIENRIFIPFFTTRKNGSGIGLSMCKQIVRLHNGTISVKSKLNQHTAFTIMV